MAMFVFKPGTRFIDGKLVEVEEEVEKDNEENDDKRVAREIRKVANTVMPRSIVMEEDVPSTHLSGKLPIFDMEMWWKGNTLPYQLYAKPMASRALARSGPVCLSRQHNEKHSG